MVDVRVAWRQLRAQHVAPKRDIRLSENLGQPVIVENKPGAGGTLRSGQIDLMFVNLPHVLPHIRSGRMRALAVASARRASSLPDVPTMAEAGVPDFVVDSWSGVLAPAGTPKAVIDKLSLEINKIAKEKSTAESLATQGAIPLPGTSADYARRVRFETQRWGEVIRKANIALD